MSQGHTALLTQAQEAIVVLRERIQELETLVQTHAQVAQEARQWLQMLIHPLKMRHDPDVRETPLATLHRIWEHVSPDERRRFLAEQHEEAP